MWAECCCPSRASNTLHRGDSESGNHRRVALVHGSLVGICDYLVGQSINQLAVSEGDPAKTQACRAMASDGEAVSLGPDEKTVGWPLCDRRAPTGISGNCRTASGKRGGRADKRTNGNDGSALTASPWITAEAPATNLLYNHHAQIEATDDFGRTPLLVAHAEAAEKLLTAHANWIALDKRGNNSLHYAAEDSAHHLEILFRAGFNVADARNNSGLTPLHFATLAGKTESARWLLNHGANPNAVTSAPYSVNCSFSGTGKWVPVPAGNIGRRHRVDATSEK